MTNPKNNKESFKLDFSGFILSLNTSVLIHLGEIPDPESRQRTINMSAANHTINILEVLEEKTRGNLSEEEQNLINDVLYELRMKILKS